MNHMSSAEVRTALQFINRKSYELIAFCNVFCKAFNLGVSAKNMPLKIFPKSLRPSSFNCFFFNDDDSPPPFVLLYLGVITQFIYFLNLLMRVEQTASILVCKYVNDFRLYIHLDYFLLNRQPSKYFCLFICPPSCLVASFFLSVSFGRTCDNHIKKTLKNKKLKMLIINKDTKMLFKQLATRKREVSLKSTELDTYIK